jgi:hypothetical protein
MCKLIDLMAEVSWDGEKVSRIFHIFIYMNFQNRNYMACLVNQKLKGNKNRIEILYGRCTVHLAIETIDLAKVILSFALTVSTAAAQQCL